MEILKIYDGMDFIQKNNNAVAFIKFIPYINSHLSENETGGFLKLSLIGLPQAGKTTLFEALTRSELPVERKMENRIGVVNVPDDRIDRLSDLYSPRKTTYAKVEYFLPAAANGNEEIIRDKKWSDVRDSDAFIHIIRNFQQNGTGPADPLADFLQTEEELILADLIVVEKRLERLELEKKKGRGYNEEEHKLLLEVQATLENNIPLRKDTRLAAHPLLRGFTFLSAKPSLIIFNNNDHSHQLPEIPELISNHDCLAVQGQLEHEISKMDDAESMAFLKEYDIEESARERVIRQSYTLLGLISYFTVGEDEVRAWTICKEMSAVEAAGVIHTDIQKGFIRAETVAYDDLINTGNYAEARKKGLVRLEGKSYKVQDGDIMNFRFNV